MLFLYFLRNLSASFQSLLDKFKGSIITSQYVRKLLPSGNTKALLSFNLCKLLATDFHVFPDDEMDFSRSNVRNWSCVGW